MKKKPDHDNLSATVRNEDVTIVAATRFKKVAMLIAFARIVVENTSAGINQAPGPIPSEKKHKYKANPITPTVALPPSSSKKVNAMMISATIIPPNDAKNNGRLPLLSNSFPATMITAILRTPKKIKTKDC
mmetsp:Transcript_27030/g.41403  ORF Transcript_27030/g.41403 Transcript_27030/m.41403 type:complete len:131 (+) Transcript_27030:601-993(+)